MARDERGYLMVPHEIATGADCDGRLIVEEHGAVVNLKCNCCGAVVDTVPIDRAGTRLMELASICINVLVAGGSTYFPVSASSKRSSAGSAAKA